MSKTPGDTFALPLPTCDLCQKSIHGTAHQPRGSMDRYHIACWRDLLNPAPPPPRPLPPPVRVAPPSPGPAPLMPAPRKLSPPPPQRRTRTRADDVVEALQICPLPCALLSVAIGGRPSLIAPHGRFCLTRGWYHLPDQEIPVTGSKRDEAMVAHTIRWLDCQDPDTREWRAVTVREVETELGVNYSTARELLLEIGEELRKKEGNAFRYRLKPMLRGAK